MRLTLRTLLAYLDDTLDSAQVKKIGQKVAESDTAQELIARIKQVTRRRRITTPPETGPSSKMDANTIAEYLEDTLSEDKVAELEQVCLGSDVHLAEMAACHQLLTLILGEPMLIPPSSKQRMYQLVKGREAIPFRKAVAEEDQGKVAHDPSEDDKDNTLRMTLPGMWQNANWKSRLGVIGGAVAACAILALALFQVLKTPDVPKIVDNLPKETRIDESKDKSNNKDQTADPNKDKQANKDVVNPGKDKEDPKKDMGVVPPINKDKTVEPKDKGQSTKKDDTGNKDKSTPKNPVDPKLPEFASVSPPSDKVMVVTNYDPRQNPMGPLLQMDFEKKNWHRLDGMRPGVLTNRKLVALPGFQGVVQTPQNLEVKLWGVLPEYDFAVSPVRETIVELHQPEKDVALDMTFDRGRLLITSYNTEPVQVRIRFADPTNPQKPVAWDLILLEKGTNLFIERLTSYTPEEPYYSNRENPNRVGPLAYVHMLVRKGKTLFRGRDGKEHMLTEPPGNAYVKWDSFKGQSIIEEKKEVEPFFTDQPGLPDQLPADQKAQRLEVQKKIGIARDALAGKLVGNSSSVAIALGSSFKSKDPLERLLVLQSYGALDELPNLVDALGSDNDNHRRWAIGVLKRWITFDRDNDYKLFNELNKLAYNRAESNIILSLLHDLPPKAALEKDTYSYLVDFLDHPKPALRELAAYHLYFGLQQYFPNQPMGLDIKYGPSAPPEIRQAAQQAWRQRIEAGKIPPKQSAGNPASGS